MKFTPRILVSATAIALTCVVSAAAYFYNGRKTEINETLTFCKLQLNVFNYFDKLISFIESAKRCVNVCMPSIHNPAIQKHLVDLLLKKNIRVRIIIDQAGYNDSTAFFLEELVEAGAEIKWRVGNNKMQHKFCLVDDEILMIGTFDWGNDLTADHWNYVYITNKLQLVKRVMIEFYKIWMDCEMDLECVIRGCDNEIHEVIVSKPNKIDSDEIETPLECHEKETFETPKTEVLEPLEVLEAEAKVASKDDMDGAFIVLN